MNDQNIYKLLGGLLDVDNMEAAPHVMNTSLIRDRLNAVMGWVTVGGVVFDRVRNRCGKVNEDGQVQTLMKTLIGSVDAEGQIRNHFGLRLGSIDEDGTIRSLNNLKVGSVKNLDATSRIMAGGAALVLLLREVNV